MGFFGVLQKNNIQKAYLPKISLPGQIAFEISAQLCSDNSIQILLNMTQFITLGTKSNEEGFAWSHSPRQFASQCLFLASTPFRCCSFKIFQQIPKFHKFNFDDIITLGLYVR